MSEANELEQIRARHEADCGFESDGMDNAEWRAALTMLATRAHTDRATLLRLLDAAREELREVKVSSRHPEVIRWRNDGIEACAQIADRYQCEYAAQDMRALLTRAQGESS